MLRNYKFHTRSLKLSLQNYHFKFQERIKTPDKQAYDNYSYSCPKLFDLNFAQKL